MANRPAPLSEAQQLEIGRAVLDGRRGGVRWKTLEAIYNRGRITLWRCALLAAAANETSLSRMKHLSG